MKVLLIGNYAASKQQSMLKFATLLKQLLEGQNHEVTVVQPPRIVGRLTRAEEGLGKWLGYVDRFILFPTRVKRLISAADLVHVCDQANSLYYPWLRTKAHVITCHDLIALRSAREIEPHTQTRLTGRLYQRLIFEGLRRAQHVVCVSRETQQQLQSLDGVVPDRITVVPNALNYAYRPMATSEALRVLGSGALRLPRPFFLHVGSNAWYKNRGAAVRIVNHLRKTEKFGNHHLILAGKPWPADLRRQIAATTTPSAYCEFVAPSNEELNALYALADGLIFPSLREGFGWPIIEAQAAGCPVFTSNRSPMTEVGGKGAVYFDPENEESAAAIIARALADTQSMVEQGHANVARFSAEAMTDGYLRVYRRVLDEKKLCVD